MGQALRLPRPRSHDHDVETTFLEHESYRMALRNPWVNIRCRFKHESLNISTGVRSRFLNLVCQNTYLSVTQKQPNIDCYLWYLQTQLESSRSQFEHMVTFQPTTITGSLDPFFEVFIVLWQHARDVRNFSLETAAQALRESKAVNVIMREGNRWQPHMDQQLAFWGFGFLSMLYRPKNVKFSEGIFQVEIKHPSTRYHYSYSSFKLDSYSFGRDDDNRECFGKFLRNFGNLLLHTSVDKPIANTSKNDKCTLISVKQFNAHALRLTCGIKFAWVDILDAHLDFDTESKTLHIFRFPSICMLNIPAIKGERMKNVLHSCGSSVSNPLKYHIKGSLEEYMKEIIISIHFIFGQTEKARNIFRSKDAFQSTPKSYHDPLLHTLCSQDWQFADLLIECKSTYSCDDFPVLWAKLDILRGKVEEKRPKGLKELWQDSRDSNRWFTLWAVLIFGGLTLLFTIVQIALSAAQLYYSRMQNTEGS